MKIINPLNSTANAVESTQCRSDGEIWEAEGTIEIPSAAECNIVSYSFANLDRYDIVDPIFVDANEPSQSFKAGEVKRMVRRLIAGLKIRGLNKGDCVCMHAFNTIWYPVIWLAVIGAGGIFFGVNPATPGPELQKLLLLTRTKFVFADASLYTTVAEAAASCSIGADAIWALPKGKDNDSIQHAGTPFTALLEDDESDWAVACDGDTAAYCTTSGTTGLPKAAKIPHSYFVAQCSMIEERLRSRSYQPKQLICLPVFHTFAAPLALLLPLRLGTLTYFLPRFENDTFAECIKRYQITDTAIVPPILTTLLALPPRSTLLQSLRYVLCAGAPITATIQSKLYALLKPDAVIAQVWGATELGWVTMFDPSDKDESGSVGKLLPGIKMKVSEPQIVGNSTCGEALIQSPAIFKGYLANDRATVAAFNEEGFYKTGDLVYVQYGKVFVVGREKETMKVNGWQVSPSEIENVLREHPMVHDAAVFGIAGVNQQGLELVQLRAYVVRLPLEDGGRGEQISAEELKRFVADKLLSYKQLTGGVVFVDSIPRNPTGKILRRLLPTED